LTTRDYSIRSAQAEDIPALSAIELAAAQLLRGYAPEAVLAETTDECALANAARDGHLWVASTGNTPVGFALVKLLADDLPHLDELDVDPSHGRRGLGTALVRKVCDWAASSKYAMLTLTTFRAVAWNFPFYTRLGTRRSPTTPCVQSWPPSYRKKRLVDSILRRERSWAIDVSRLRTQDNLSTARNNPPRSSDHVTGRFSRFKERK
jgi:GNAT superfamily N-acetyltransferase